MNERNISVKKIFIILFSFIWMQNSILSYFRGIIDNINYLTEIYDIVNILIIIILLLLLIPNVVRNISFKNVFFCFAFIVIFVLSFNNNLVSEYVDENFL